MNGKTLSVRLDAKLYDDCTERCTAAGISRSSYIENLIRLDMSRLDNGGKSATEAARSAEKGAKIDQLLDEGIIAAMQAKGVGIISALDDKTIAQLALSRAPKPREGDREIEDGLLSLTGCMKHLPAVKDLTGEIAKKESRIGRLESEMELLRVELLYFRDRLKQAGDKDWWDRFKAAMEKFRDECVRQAKDAEVRGVDFEALRALIVYPGKEEKENA